MNSLCSNQSPLLTTLFERTADLFPDNIALECGTIAVTYRELELQANRLANYLSKQGVKAGTFVGVLLERSVDSYVSMLAVLKAGATYVPIEAEHPDDRINYILSDLRFQTIIVSSQQHTRPQIDFSNPLILDQVQADIAQQSSSRPNIENLNEQPLSYVIYTSGSTGKPKGVEIMHRSICHYVSTASNLYDMTPHDKVYQGFSLAFDASMEEVWMAFANGGTAVLCTSKEIRSGVGLVDFLIDNQVTVFSTVPTLLTTVGDLSIPSLRLLILGGEMCPSNLIKNHSRPNLRIVNTYGPTEATVIATFAECVPEKPVTIGKPLPGYDIVILDENQKPVKYGQSGELCIAGIGLARGYVNSPEMTAAKFISHPYNSKERLYRTGDLCSLNPEGDILFLGRIDDQVKIRGFRIELHEIETVMTTYPGIKEAVVAVQDSEQNPILVAYLIVNHSSDLDLQAFRSFLQRKLPQAMIPVQYELLDKFPVLSNGKVDRKALPKSKYQEQERPYTPPKTELEMMLAAAFEQVLGHEKISIEADFFYDLGGHSLTAAKLVSYLRKTPALTQLSMQNLYAYPSIQKLAGMLSETTTVHVETSREKNHCSALQYKLCGMAQGLGCLFQYAIEAWQMVLIFLCYQYFQVIPSALSARSIAMFVGLFAGLPLINLTLNIVIKWLLLGRIKPGRYKLWGWFYLRWWLVRRIHTYILPAKSLEGTPILNLYYRLLGVKIGRNCYLGSSAIAAYDLVSIGDNSSIGYDCKLFGYEVKDGWLTIGPISIGNHCYIGARALLSPDTVMKDHAKLDNMTLVQSHSIVNEGVFYSGSPGKNAKVPPDHISKIINNPADSASVIQAICSGIIYYSALLWVWLVHFISYVPGFILILYIKNQTHSFASIFWAAPLAAILSMITYFSLLYLCKKIFLKQVKPGIYPIKSGFYLRQWIITKLLDMDKVGVLADSLYYPWLLRCLGAKLGKRVEMGETPHLIPDLITLQDDAFTASSVGMAWPNIYQGFMQILPIHIGKRAFSGNVSLVPSGTDLGNESLLGCLTRPPAAQQAREKRSAWLGSPPMFLPRREDFSAFAEEYTTKPSKSLFISRLMIEFLRVILPSTYNFFAIVSLFTACQYLLLHNTVLTTLLLLPLLECSLMIILALSLIGLKWLVQGRLSPKVKPLWDTFIREIDLVEYSWTYFICPRLGQLLLGTPFFPILLRSLGAKIGKQVFIDTYQFAEFDLISVGDEACINAHTLIDTHLYEDRIFKTSTIEIQAGCNVGIGSIILYDTVMEKNASLGSLSLLMKGEQLPANSSWQGLPCQPVSSNELGTLPTLQPINKNK